MAHVPHLITDLALILFSAGIVTLIFKKLNQPVVLGYIIAGLLVSPNFSLFPTVTEIESIKIWAEIGVIFLLFSLGLEFSFKKLVKVGGTSAISGLFEIAAMLFVGYFTGQLLGWGRIDSLFLGGIIAISSTTIIFRAFDELGLKTQKFAGTVIGILIIEDLAAVLLMVLLSTVAVSQNFEGSEMLTSVLKLGFFLVLWFLMGIYLLPSLLKKLSKHISDETLLIISIALCLGMVVFAANVGFSAALGAFIMGSILAETTKAERIEHVLKSVKDLFGAVFFVSVGMLINPSILLQYAIPVVILTLVVMLGKTLFVTSGSLISGLPLKQSVQAGTSMSQIGEFSFIIATLGVTLGVTSDFLYPIAVGVSVITTFTTPYMIKLAEPLYTFLEKILPQKLLNAINNYSTGAQHITAESNWKKVLNEFFQVIIFNGVICLAIVLMVVNFIDPFFIIWGIWGSILSAFIAMSAMGPFLYMLSVRKINRQSYTELWLNRYNRGPIIGMEIARVALGIFLIGFLLDRLFSTITALSIGVLVIIVVTVLFRRRLRAFSNRIEKRFMDNLNLRETMHIKSPIGHLLPWDAHMANFDIDVDSTLVGIPLEQLKLREKFGINLAMIERGARKIMVPTKNEKLYPFDRITVIGTDEQILNFKNTIETANNAQVFEQSEGDVTLSQITVQPGFIYLGKTIRETNFRQCVNGMIVGIERNGERILNPDSNLRFELNDTLWIVGDSKLVKALI
ncbi:MAG: cation:proton antiporter [Bacteroidia bacterium]